MAVFKMGKTVMKSMFKKPATLMYPVIPREYGEGTRGHIQVDMDQCILCGICSKKCPSNAITVDRAAKTWSIQRMRCIQCDCCTDYCPKKCLFMKNTYTSPGQEKLTETFTAPEPEPAPAAEA